MQRYTYTDPIIKDTHTNWKGLFIENNTSSLLRIFRLLSGTIKIKDDFKNQKVYSFKTNYFSSPYQTTLHFNQSLLTNNFPNEIGLNDLSEFFEGTLQNNNFYTKIEHEILNCLIARKEERYLESFLFLYRILEGISYSIPLIYTSKSNDFLQSFQALQKFISKNAKDGELQFFKKFIQETYKNEDFFNTTIDINFSQIDIEVLREKYYTIYKNKIKDDNIKDSTENEEIKISFIGFFEFMIELRNRYFHFLQGTWQNNIGTSSIIHPDLFFKPIVDLGINWVAIIFFEIMNFDFENSQRFRRQR